MKHRIRDRDGKPVVTIERDGEVLDEREMPDAASAIALRDRAFLDGAETLPEPEKPKPKKGAK